MQKGEHNIEPRSARFRRSPPFLLVAAAVLAIYLITYNGAVTSADEVSLLAATESLVKHGDLRTDQLIWAIWAHGWEAQGTLGPDGHVYSKKGFGLPILLAPAVSAAFVFPGVSKTHAAFLVSVLCSVGVVLVMFALARRWGADERSALGVSLVTAFATPLWPYSRTLFQETPSALALLLAVFAITGPLRTRDALLAGVALAFGIAVRTTNAIALGPMLLYLLYRGRRFAPGRLARLLLAVVGPAAVALLVTGWLNWQRFGSPLSTGYSSHETFSTPLLQGLYGLLLSPAKGLPFFAPVVLAALIAAPASWRRRPAETALLLALAGSLLVLFGMWYDWGGGLAWGPRFVLPAIPLLMPLLLPVLEGEGRRATRILAYVLVALSVSIQFAASTTSYLDTAGEWPVVEAFRQLVLGGWRNIDSAWLRARPDVQWLPIAVFSVAAMLALTGLTLVTSPRAATRRARGVSLALYLPLPLLVLIVLGSVSGLLRIHADQRLPGGDDYRALAVTLGQSARPSDVVLLDNHTRTEFFLSEDRSRTRRYDLLRGDTLSPPATSLLARLAQQSGVIWLVTDRPAEADVAKPEEQWLDANAFRWREVSASPYARLIGYRGVAAADMPQGQEGFVFENGWEATRLRIEPRGYNDREGAGPAFDIRLQPGARAAAKAAASLQLVAPDGSLAWQMDRQLDQAAGATELRGAVAVPAEARGMHRLRLLVYDPETGVRAKVTAPGHSSGQDYAEIGQVRIGE